MRPVSLSCSSIDEAQGGIRLLSFTVCTKKGPTALFFSSKPRLCALADSDEESSSAGSSDEEEASPFEPQVSLWEKTTVVAAEG